MPYGDSIIQTQDLESKLDLTPFGGYDESLEALDSLLDEEYEIVRDASADMHPRVSHEVFRYPALRDNNYAAIEAEMVEDVEDVLVENSDKELGWLDKKLFNIGYIRAWRKPNEDRLHKSPSLNYIWDNIPNSPNILRTSYGYGKRKKESDDHYRLANKMLLNEIGNQQIVIE